MTTSERLAVALNGYGVREGGRREVLAWRDVVQTAEMAEEAGYGAIFTPEIGAREAFSTLVGLVPHVATVRLATGVVPLGSRDPRRMAMEATTLHDLSGGRGVLGVGSRRPIDRTRAEVAAVRALLAGEEPESGDRRRPIAPLDLVPERMPIYLAALGPRMTQLAGEVADGVILNWCTPERVARARAEVARGAAVAGRDPAAVTVCVYVRTCVGMAEDLALDALREACAEYARMPYYVRQFEAMGLGSEAHRAAGANAPGDVPEAFVDAVCARGDRDGAVGRLAAYYEAGADVVVVYPVPALHAVSSITGTILGVAPVTALER